MDLCSLEDAFPNIETGSIHKTFTGSAFPYVGGTDSKPSREERRAARKRAKKVKGPAQTYFESIAEDIPPTDPDRPAVKRMDSVTPEQDKKDGFAIPVLPKASCLFSDAGTPSYFGKSYDDESEEGISSFSAALDDNPNYNNSPEGQDITKEVQKAADFKNSFDLKGVDKAGGELPEPNVKDTWKPLSHGASYTAFVKDSPSTEGGWSMNAEYEHNRITSKSTIPEVSPAQERKDSGEKDFLMGRINELVARLENLEKKKSQDSQTEILMFVGTGVFLLLSFEIFTRR